MTATVTFPVAHNRAVRLEELRRLLLGIRGLHKSLPFGIAALDSYLPEGGLACGALHEVVPAVAAAMPAAFGFVAAILAHACPPAIHPGVGPSARPPARPLLFVMPAYGQREYGRPHGHGLNSLGLDPRRLILVETSHRKDALWAIEEALRSAVPAAVVGVIDKLDLRTSQRLHLAAMDSGLPLLLLRPPAASLPSCAYRGWASAAATRWRVGTAEAARDRFGLLLRPRWHLQLERCRNGRPGEWVVEYDHVAHRFSLAAALANSARARGAGEKGERGERGEHVLSRAG